MLVFYLFLGLVFAIVPWGVGDPSVAASVVLIPTSFFIASIILLEFGATIMVAGNIEGQTRTIPLAIYTLTSRPGGMEQSWRLVGLALLLACAALAASEWLERKRPADAAA